MSSENSGSCEGCSTTFSIFKRKKSCNICKQEFCQACLTRQPNRNIQTLNGTKDRVCIICQNLSSNSTTVDEIMKFKTKHLRLFLQAKNIQTNTCKEKRELVDLILRFNRNNTPTPPQNPPPRYPQPPPRYAPPPPTQPQAPPTNNQQQQQNRTINDTVNNFMSNVQDFVNYNVNAAFNTGSPNTTNNGPTPTTTTGGHSRTNSTSSTNNSNDNNNQRQQSASTSSSSFSTNVNDLFNFISDQIPPVIQQTFTNNRFTFNNIFNGTPQTTASATTNTTNTNSTSFSNNNSNRNANQTASATNSNENDIPTPPPPPPPPQQQQQQQTASNTANNDPTIRRRASISDLNTEDDIENLTVRQMKEILTSNFVDFKGVCERNELIERVKTLYQSHVRNKRLTEEINQQQFVNNNDGEKAKATEDDLCKICMDALVDCVLLDCGHMISCTKCGKRLAECPICRKNIIKVVRVFKS